VARSSLESSNLEASGGTRVPSADAAPADARSDGLEKIQRIRDQVPFASLPRFVVGGGSGCLTFEQGKAWRRDLFYRRELQVATRLEETGDPGLRGHALRIRRGIAAHRAQRGWTTVPVVATDGQRVRQRTRETSPRPADKSSSSGERGPPRRRAAGTAGNDDDDPHDRLAAEAVARLWPGAGS
jgi:hypothetical protein